VYNLGTQDIRRELEAFAGGTRLAPWYNIDRRFISMVLPEAHLSRYSGSPSGAALPLAVKSPEIEMDEALMGSPFGNIEVRGAHENNLMSYTLAPNGLESVVTWTLTPSSAGTHLHMEQSGFWPDPAGLGTDRLTSAVTIQS